MMLGRRLYSHLLFRRSRASNPNLERSLQIEKTKKQCIRRRICDSEVWIESYPFEFAACELGERRDLDPALADFKVAQKHLKAEVRACELDEKTNPLGMTVYHGMKEFNGAQMMLFSKGVA